MHQVSGTGWSRRTLLRTAGAAGLVAVTAGALVVGAATPALALQDGWRWCHQCDGLWFSAHGSGRCPATEYGSYGHSQKDSGLYSVYFSDENGPGQDGWRYCEECRGLFFYLNPGHPDDPAPGFGVCYRDPVTQQQIGHRVITSGRYTVEYTRDNDGRGGQTNWRWCRPCERLFFNGHDGSGCPGTISGYHYNPSGTWDYLLKVRPPSG
jgi:hypothetical protein